MATPEGRTKDGWETQFGTCHLAHFLLFHLLKPLLLSSAAAEFPSRVVNVSSYVQPVHLFKPCTNDCIHHSYGHRTCEVQFDDYNFEKKPYDPWLAYGQAKTGNIYMSNEIEKRFGAANLHSTSLHPGGIASGLTAHLGDMVSDAMKDPAVYNYMKSPEQGAATSVYAALSEEWAHKGGKYLANCVIAEPWKGGEYMAVGDDGYAPWAYDDAKAQRLWAESCSMVGITDE